jgi:uncharacterized protein YdhG (YjbR/CyaY superfamily)
MVREEKRLFKQERKCDKKFAKIEKESVKAMADRGKELAKERKERENELAKTIKEKYKEIARRIKEKKNLEKALAEFSTGMEMSSRSATTIRSSLRPSAGVANVAAAYAELGYVLENGCMKRIDAMEGTWACTSSPMADPAVNVVAYKSVRRAETPMRAVRFVPTSPVTNVISTFFFLLSPKVSKLCKTSHQAQIVTRVTSHEHRRNHGMHPQTRLQTNSYRDHPSTTVKTLTQVKSYVFLLPVFLSPSYAVPKVE